MTDFVSSWQDVCVLRGDVAHVSMLQTPGCGIFSSWPDHWLRQERVRFCHKSARQENGKVKQLILYLSNLSKICSFVILFISLQQAHKICARVSHIECKRGLDIYFERRPSRFGGKLLLKGIFQRQKEEDTRASMNLCISGTCSCVQIG